MIPLVLPMIAVVGASMALGGWYDLFHILVGVPIIVVGLMLLRRVQQRRSDEDPDPLLDADDTPALRAGLGFVNGVALVLLLFGGFRLVWVVGLTDCFMIAIVRGSSLGSAI